jgi:hypothetical protein
MTHAFRTYRCRVCDRALHTTNDPEPPVCCEQSARFLRTVWRNPYQHGKPTGMKAPALDFNQTRERVVPVGDGIRVDSLNDIRRIERESEKMARDGVGEQLIFRKYAQDRGNLHEHTMGPDPSKTPSPQWLREHGGVGHVEDTRGKGPEDVRVEMGPGAREELASALPESPV